jgi:protein phosphatase
MQTTMTRIKHVTVSKQGKRKKNEDDFFPHENQQHNNLFMVCDGIGGHGDGDLAAAFVQMQLARELNEVQQVSAKIIKQAILKTDEKLKYYALQIGNPKMGSTVAAIQFLEERAVIGWVGDSRVYHFRNGQIRFKTTDHTLMELMIENGELSQAETKDFPLKHVIYQAVGPIDSKIKPSAIELTDVMPGDFFFIATDGVFEAWNDQELEQLFLHENADFTQELTEKCNRLSKDNFTFTIISIN